MENTSFKFWVFCLNIADEVNKYYDDDFDWDYCATDGGGNCFFDEELHIWRQDDDWYCSIYTDGNDCRMTEYDYLEDAYMTIYESENIPTELRTYNPTLLFHNEAIIY